MIFSAPQILGFIVIYLSLLFTVGYLADRGRISQRILNHPAVYVLSLGVYAGALAIHGAVELAFNYGYSFLAYYVGVVIMFFLLPLLLQPIYRVARIYQLSSLADFLTFRFRSQRVGALTTLVMITAMLPLLALQIQMVSDSIHILSGNHTRLLRGDGRLDGLALIFCAIITIFTMLFGARQLGPHQRHEGLVAAIAFESLLKLLALLFMGGAAVYTVFGGFGELDSWLQANPNILELLDSPLRQDSAHALLLIFFAGAVVLPHMFHMTITENPGGSALRHASWGLPLYLLLMSLPILPITWAGLRLDSDLPQAYAALAIGLEQQSGIIVAIAFFAGLSAASAVIIVSTLALANMSLNHLVLPLQLRSNTNPLERSRDLYVQLRWLRRALVAAIILAGYLYYRAVSGRESLVDLGLASFIGALQFLPAALAAVYWPGANRNGMIAGLAGGFLIWFLALMSDFDPQFIRYLYVNWLEAPESLWSATAIASLGINVALFIAVSLLTRTTREERIGAEICSMDDRTRPMRLNLGLTSPAQFKDNLAAVLGETTAGREVDRALNELQLPSDEGRPYALRQLRARVEANLSGLLGPTVAYEILQRHVPYRLDQLQDSEDISLIERRLDLAQGQFTGLAADLNNLRRYHRETLQRLPIGVLSLGRDGEVLMWNRFMEQLTGVQADSVVGSYLSSLPPGWSRALADFSSSERETEHRLNIADDDTGGGQPAGTWVSLHKAAVASSSRASKDQVIVVEDLTAYQLLEQELLHSERLASIGRLAAGVAHEIGNPVTGISSLAQNLEYETDPEAIQDTASDILKQTERVSRIVESLVNFSHTGRGGTAQTPLIPLNIADCVDEAIHLLQLDRVASPMRYDNLCDRELLVRGDSQKLLQAFLNLLGNARDASEEGSTITVDCSAQGTTVVVQVTDSGSGIDPDIRSKVFEPFFTTKDPGSGTGLGLSLVYSILEDLEGSISLESPVAETGTGTRFTLTLTRAQYDSEYNAAPAGNIAE